MSIDLCESNLWTYNNRIIINNNKIKLVEGDAIMPVIRVTMGKKNDVEMKKMLIEKLTSAAVEVTKAPASVFTVLIEELEHDNMGIGGQTLAEIHANK